MAEEARADELTPIVDDDQTQDPEPQIDPKEVEIQEAAKAKGWNPDHDGPEFVTAKEFLQREPLFDKIKNQSKELKSLKKTLDAMSNQFQTQVKAQVQLKINELKAAKREAIEAGDADQVEKIDAAIDEQKSFQTEEVQQVPDEVAEWIGKNKWFSSDKELNDWAIAHNKEAIVEADGDAAESLKATEVAVKKAHPECFNAEGEYIPKHKRNTKPKTPPSPVAGAEEPKDQGKKNTYSRARLSDEQKRVYDQVVKGKQAFMSHEEYFKGLETIGELQ